MKLTILIALLTLTSCSSSVFVKDCEQVIADGTIVTEGDKTALIAELDKWIK